MKKYTTFIGLVILGALFTGVGCEYHNGKDMVTIDAATQKKIDDMTTKIEGLEDQLATKQKEDKEDPKEPVAITIADFAGTWKATKFLIKDGPTDPAFDLIGLKELEMATLSISENGNSVISFKSKGEAEEQLTFTLILQDGKLQFKGLDKSQEEPFEFTLEADSMNWMQPPLDDDVPQVSWERVSKDVTVPQFLAIEDIAGTWHATKMVMTDSSTGTQTDYLKLGVTMDVIIGLDSTVYTITTGPNGKTDTSGKSPLSIKNGNHVIVNKDAATVTLGGNVMHWTIESPDLVEMTLEKEVGL